MPGPTIEVRSGNGVLVEWENQLPERHYLPIDHGLCGAGADLPEVRTAVHVHGAKAPPESDGYPEHWFVPGQSAVGHYPNRQEAATLWYHDHAMGIERLNQYAGLFGMYLVRDELESSLGLPAGEFEVPLILCDRLFDAEGQIVYPSAPTLESPWVSEVYGDVILVNGTIFPYLEVAPQPYRFRVLNASNSRFLSLSLSDGFPLYQIGTEQGFLATPAEQRALTLAPAERADLVVDFLLPPSQKGTFVEHSGIFPYVGICWDVSICKDAITDRLIDPGDCKVERERSADLLGIIMPQPFLPRGDPFFV